jgi:hypothetical protein
MLSQNSLKMAAILMCICLFFFCAPNTRSANADLTEDPDVAYDKLRSLLESGHAGEDPFWFSKWTDYVKKNLRCDNNDYLQALEQLSLKYMDEIVRAGECMRINSRSREKHSSQWLDDLIEHFGLPFVQENRALIATNMQLSIAHEEAACKDSYAGILYQEALLHAAYKHYLITFFEFYDTLDMEGKQFFKTRHEALTLFIGLIDQSSFAPIITSTGGPNLLVYEIFAKRENEELFNFMKTYTSSENYHPFKAATDLDRIERD